MKKMLITLIFLLPFSLQAKYQFDETFFIPIEHEWKKGKETSSEKGMCLTRYLLNSENEYSWSRLLTIQFKDRQLIEGTTAEEAMAREQSRSPTTQWEIIKSLPNDVIYERTFPNGEHELVRMVMTKKGLHRAAYLKRGPFDEKERSLWIERLTNGVVGN